MKASTNTPAREPAGDKPHREIMIFAAHDSRCAIGRRRGLIWNEPAHVMALDRALEGDDVLVVGRQQALDWAMLLAALHREVLVLSRSVDQIQGFRALPSPEAIMAATDQSLMVLGGAGAYAAFLPHATVMHLTVADTVFAEADVFFPDWQRDDWEVAVRGRLDTESGVDATSYVLFNKSDASSYAPVRELFGGDGGAFPRRSRGN